MIEKSTMSIEDARVNSKFTVNQAATYAKISVKKLKKYEENSGRMPLKIAKKLLKLYKIDIDSVCFN